MSAALELPETWTVGDVYRRAETGQYVLTLERGDRWVTVDISLRFYVEKRLVYFCSLTVDWVRMADSDVERDVTAWLQAHAEDEVLDRCLSAEAA